MQEHNKYSPTDASNVSQHSSTNLKFKSLECTKCGFISANNETRKQILCL